MAASGELAELAAGAGGPAAAAQRTVSLARGRVTQQERRRADLECRLRAWGFTDVGAYLRHAYTAGASLEDLARTTGLGRARLRAEIDTAGITVRPTGVNVATSKRARAGANDAALAARLGVADARAWLQEQRAAGVSLRQQADVGVEGDDVAVRVGGIVRGVGFGVAIQRGAGVASASEHGFLFVDGDPVPEFDEHADQAHVVGERGRGVALPGSCNGDGFEAGDSDGECLFHQLRLTWPRRCVRPLRERCRHCPR